MVKTQKVSSINLSQGYGWGNTMPEKVVAGRVNAGTAPLMNMAFNLLGNKEKYFNKYSEQGYESAKDWQESESI